jgi:hypothetical protein
VNIYQQNNQVIQDLGREPSPGIWGDCNWDELVQKPGRGIAIWDDFDLTPSAGNLTPAIGNFGRWANWSAATFTMTDAIEEGGVVSLLGTAANTSFILTSNTGLFRFLGGSTAYNVTGGKFWMEMRIAVASVTASLQGIFFGLADNTGSQINSSNTTVIASGGNTLTTTKNLIGVFNRTTTGPTDWSAVYQPAAGTAVYPTGLTTLVNTTNTNVPTTVGGTAAAAAMVAYAASTDKGKGTGFIKIGMTFDPTGDNPAIPAPATPPTGQTAGVLYQPTIQFYVNGAPLPHFLNKAAIMAATTFPTNCVFSPVFQYMTIGGTGSAVYLDWIRFAQAASF